MQALHAGAILEDDVPFELYAYSSLGAVVKQKYRGAWLLVDNGYLSHATTVLPIKITKRSLDSLHGRSRLGRMWSVRGAGALVLGFALISFIV